MARSVDKANVMWLQMARLARNLALASKVHLTQLVVLSMLLSAGDHAPC